MEQTSAECGWKFPNNNYGRIYGFDTTDMETFKKDPVAHFAREICQNSIDAHEKNNPKPVRIEFKSFSINGNNIPGMSELKREMNYCRNYMAECGNKNNQKTSRDIYDNICGNRTGYIQCLRVSDFNTTGLYGAKNHEIKEPFYALTRGSGSSDKGSGSAGSKGIGKYAAFVISKTNTVFYSTHAKNPKTGEIEDAHSGISKLCSRPIGDDGLHTLGEGYYGVGKQNYPIESQLRLDPKFFRNENEYGTDVYIIGFKERENWKNEVLKKTLDSFIVAIIKGALEVNIDGIEVNKKTLPRFIKAIKSQNYITAIDKNIIAQFEIMSDPEAEGIKQKSISIYGGSVKYYAKVYQKAEQDFATLKCARIRFPYMKIDDVKLNTLAQVSAICIIERNEINDILRNIENPQHTEWQKNRVRDEETEYDKVKHVLQRMSDGLNDFIAEIISTSDADQTDLEGAGDYLPDEYDDDGDGDDEVVSGKDVIVASLPKRRQFHIAGSKTDSNDGEPDTVHSSGEINEGGDSLGTNQSGGTSNKPIHPPNPDPNPDPDDVDIYGPGFQPFLKHILSRNMRFRCMRSASAESYNISFVANDTQNDCEIQILSIGDSNDAEKVLVESALVNGKPVSVMHGRIVHLSIEAGEEYKVSCIINRKDLFASKVEMYAYKK